MVIQQLGKKSTQTICEENDSCGKKQEPPVQVSSVHPTELACLQELLKRLHDRHVGKQLDDRQFTADQAVNHRAQFETVLQL